MNINYVLTLNIGSWRFFLFHSSLKSSFFLISLDFSFISLTTYYLHIIIAFPCRKSAIEIILKNCFVCFFPFHTICTWRVFLFMIRSCISNCHFPVAEPFRARPVNQLNENCQGWEVALPLAPSPFVFAAVVASNCHFPVAEPFRARPVDQENLSSIVSRVRLRVESSSF